MKKKYQNGSISLLGTAILMMLLTIAGLTFLYTARYGQLPLQDVWARWGKSATVISSELKSASGIEMPGSPAVSMQSGIKRCTIRGKVVYSDTECLDSNPSTRSVKLHDNRADAPKVPVPAQDGAAGAEQDIQMKMLDKMLK